MQQPSGRVAQLRAALEAAVDTVATVAPVGSRTRITVAIGPDVSHEQYGAALRLVQSADRWGGSKAGDPPALWGDIDESAGSGG